MRDGSSPSPGRGRTLAVARLTGLLLTAVLGLHELRYRLGVGDRTSSALEHTGHGYLATAVPLAGLALALGLSWCLLQAAVRPWHGVDGRSMSRRGLWLLASAALLVIFAGQELVEGWVSPGHPGAAAVLLGAGGWTVVPLALALGGLVTLGAGIVERAERTIARARGLRPRTLSWDPVGPPCVLVERAVLLTSDGLARHLAGRGPPAVLLTR